MATQSFYYSNLAVPGTIGNTGGISNSATTFFMTGSAPSGYPASFPFRLTFASGQPTEEVVTVNSGAGTSASPWNITRGQDGTTAQAQGQNTSVTHQACAGDYTLSRLHEGSGSADLPHGLPAAAWTSGAFATINETTESSAVTHITWSSIPQTYAHLLIIMQARLTETTVQSDDVLVTLNGDAGSYYSYLTLWGTNISGTGTGGLASSAYTTSAAAGWPMFRITASEAGAAVNAGGGWALIPNYTGTAFNKQFTSVSGGGNGTGAMVDGRVRWGWYNPPSQVAVTSVTLTAPNSTTFLIGSQFSLYGVG